MIPACCGVKKAQWRNGIYMAICRGGGGGVCEEKPWLINGL